MAFSAVLEIGDNDAKRYYKQYLLTDLRMVFNRSYTVIPDGVARCERLEPGYLAEGLDRLDDLGRPRLRRRHRAERRPHHAGHKSEESFRGRRKVEGGDWIFMHFEPSLSLPGV